MPSATLPAATGLHRVFSNLGLLLSGKAGAGLLSLVYLAIVARTLGASDYGVLILVHAYVTLVGGVVAFSGWHGLVRFGSIALEKGDHERLLKVGRFLTLVEIGFGIAAILAAILLVPVVGPHMDWPPDAMRFAADYSLATLANVRSTPLGLLQLAGRFDLIAIWFGRIATRGAGGDHRQPDCPPDPGLFAHIWRRDPAAVDRPPDA